MKPSSRCVHWPCRPRLALVAIIACILATAPSLAQLQPDFSGIWKLRQPESSGYSRVETIEQGASRLKIVVESRFAAGTMGGGLYTDHTYEIGGRPEVRTADDGIIRTVSVSWEGNTLLFLRTEREGANTSTTREAWSLSSNGMILTRTRHITTWRGATDEESVFDRQFSR